MEIENILNDKKSIDILYSLLFSKIVNNTDIIYNMYEDNQYFAINNFLFNTPNEIFLDAGAYIGNSIEKFIYKYSGVFKQIYAFEPGEKQYNAIKYRIERLINEWGLYKENIIIEKKGLSKKVGNIYFYENNQIAVNYITNEKTNSIIEIETIDNYLQGNLITFLKADIEGEELNMLYGAEVTIKKYKPKMAISIYHRPDDIFKILEYIKTLVPKYKFYIGDYNVQLYDTVLYCCI